MAVRTVKNVLKSITSYKNKEDGTYGFRTGERVEHLTGYQVSFVRPEAFDQLSPENWDALTSYYCIYLDSPPYIGVYSGNAEISFHSASIEKAIEVMEQFNQESILDWNKKQDSQVVDDSCFIVNRYFDEDRVIDYGKILKEI